MVWAAVPPGVWHWGPYHSWMREWREARMVRDAAEWRKRLAALLRQNLLECSQDGALTAGSYEDFVGLIAGCRKEAWTEDRSFCAAWHFADAFFDAVEDAGALGLVPDLTSGSGLSLQESEEIMQHIVERLEQGLEITHPVVLAYSRYCRSAAELASAGLPGCLRRIKAAAKRALLGGGQR